ncbi:PREDICTED: uncharacterized protein C20orf96 homolog isoform X3 [Chinchilla lanigera]|uniref:uncharacterized protein C20orf96 homolog isoform X3 n=1 Tax=Chinchilla lanigera TaxID=34839 RepID=UPI0006972B45|nr:PREDICTED: uncharacterized protein C20orf96 homolog isoform X3 [Chinchilla lanigera]
MAHVFPKPRHSGTHSAAHKSQFLWSKHETKPSTLPPLRQTSSYNRSKMKTFSGGNAEPHSSALLLPLLPLQSPAVSSKLTSSVTSQLQNPQEGRLREKPPPGKMPAKSRLMRMMLRNQRNLLQDICKHEHFLTEQNEEVVRTILDTEASTALQVRAMLQQEDIAVNMMDILEYSNNKLQKSKSELQEWTEKEERKKNSLEQQAEQLNARIKNTQELVSFLSTYMDHEYPIRSVQISSLVRQLQQVKDNQQEELDNLGEMRRMVLKALSNRKQEKKRKVWRSLVVKTQRPRDKILRQVIQDSQYQQKCMVKCRELIDQSKGTMPTLRADVEALQAQVRDLREVIFEDVLLRRPKTIGTLAWGTWLQTWWDMR